MQKPFSYIAFLWLILSSCKVTADNIVGTYQQKARNTSILIIKKDKTFEFTGSEIITTANSYPLSSNFNFLTRGTWELDNHQLLLTSFIADSVEYENNMTDSIGRFTSITSFNFWNRYGDPVLIRLIQLPAAKSKPHFGNSLYLFAQDFKATDTVKFHFDGYPDFNYPGSVPYAIGNNTHKIILREPYRPAVFNHLRFTYKKNNLLVSENNLSFAKKK